MEKLAQQKTRAHEAQPEALQLAAARPNRHVIRDIERGIRELKPGASLFVDTAGATHSKKDAFLEGNAAPLVSFTRVGYGGAVIVFNGLPPRHQIFVGPRSPVPGRPLLDGAPDEQRPGRHAPPYQPLKYAAVVRSGERVFLGADLSFEVPNRLLDCPETAPDKLSQLLARAEAGQFVTLGRQAVPECPGTVSRAHCVAEVVSKEALPDGTFSMSARIYPGIPGSLPVRIAHDFGVSEEVQGQRLISSDSIVELRGIGSVRMPHAEGSVEEVSQLVSESFSCGNVVRAQDALKTFLAPKRGEYSRDVVDKPRENLLDKELLLKTNVLQRHICLGLGMIREGRYEDAIAHFQRGEVLGLFGYSFQENHLWTLHAITPEAVLKNLHDIAGDSWCRHDWKRVNPGIGILAKGLAPQNEAERDLLTRWQHDISLIYAEEYTHALQGGLGGKLVSRKAELIPDLPSLHGFKQNLPREADIALFFHEQGVKLSSDLVVNRYEIRSEVMQLIGGFQTEETQALFGRALVSVPIGGVLAVGRDPGELSRNRAGAHGFAIPRPELNRKTGKDLQLRPQAAHDSLERVEALIARNWSGSFDVTPLSNSTVFVPDSAGYYHQLKSPQAVEPGVPIYVGRAFRLVLE